MILLEGEPSKVREAEVGQTSFSLKRVIGKYMNNRRSLTAKEDGNVPVLTVEYGSYRDYEHRDYVKEGPYDLEGMLCFERDRSISRKKQSAIAISRMKRAPCDPIVDGPAVKKRRMKNGKAMALGTVLNGFQKCRENESHDLLP